MSRSTPHRFQGKTRLTETLDMKLSGFYRLLGPYFARTGRNDVSARLERLRRKLESASPT